MDYKFNLETNKKPDTDSEEINRVYQSFQERIKGFGKQYNIPLFGKMIVNPDLKTYPFASPNGEQKYVVLTDEDSLPDYFDKANLSYLKGKLQFFPFEGKEIENILFVISFKDNNWNTLEKLKGNKQIIPNKSANKVFDFNTLSISQYAKDSLYTFIHYLRNRGNHFHGCDAICLWGSAGSGKSTVANVIVKELSMDMIIVNLADMENSKHGFSKSIHDIFEKAANEKKILFFDSADYFFTDLKNHNAPASFQLKGMRDTLYRELDSTDCIVIFSAISIDYFDNSFISRIARFIKLELPSNDQRLELLHKHLQSSTLDSDDYKLIAGKLIGFSHKEIINVIKEAISISANHTALSVNPNTILSIITQHKKDKEDIYKPTNDIYRPVKSKFSLDRVVLLPESRKKLEYALSVIINKKTIYDDWGFYEIDPFPRSIINFLGPSGTGKTMCAYAVADELSKQISVKTGKKVEYELLALNYSEIESKYVGEAPKNLESVFNYARGKNIVLFFDEADSFLGKRITNVTQGAEQAINSLRSTMLIQLEKYDGIVIFATNLSHNYDTAFKTRFLEEILFDLPTKETRAEIFKNHIPLKIKESHLAKPLEYTDFLDFADQTEGLSGRDIKTMVWKTLAAGASNHSVDYQFTKEDFLTTIVEYKKEKEEEKQNNGVFDPKNITAKVTPECEKMKEKISETLNNNTSLNI